jgi:uncharacterized protein
MREMYGPFDHVIAAIIVLVPLSWALLAGQRVGAATPSEAPAARRFVYSGTMAVLWLLSAAVIGLWIRGGRSWSDLGLQCRMSRSMIVAASIVAALVIALAISHSRALFNPEALQKVRAQMRAARVERVVPHTRSEFVMFFFLSLSAGICEELLYRGFLLWYVRPHLGVVLAIVVSSVAFGLGHAYQGVQGMFATAAVGAILGVLYVVTGSLLLPMIVHALIDLHSGHLGYVALQQDANEPVLQPA